MKYDAEVPPPLSSSQTAGGCCWYYCLFFASILDVCHVYGCMAIIWAPLYYLFALMMCMIRLLLLAPPFLACCGKSCRIKFEVDVPFPGNDKAERLAWAKQWYGPDRIGIEGAIGSRFTQTRVRAVRI